MAAWPELCCIILFLIVQLFMLSLILIMFIVDVDAPPLLVDAPECAP